MHNRRSERGRGGSRNGVARALWLSIGFVACLSFIAGCTSTPSSSATAVKPTPPTPITSLAEFEANVLKADLPAVVVFHSPKCSYCRELLRYMPTLGGRHAGEARFFSVNTFTCKDIKKQYKVKGIPVVAFFKGGKERKRVAGGRPLAEWRRIVATFVR